MPAARSFVLMLDEPYIVVEALRQIAPLAGTNFHDAIHQEDVCQALG